MAKQIDPMAKRTPIHHAMARGAHQVEPDGVRRGCLRCQRDSHVTRVPSGRPRTSRVTNGPKPRPPRRRQPSGTSTYAWDTPVTLSGARRSGPDVTGPWFHIPMTTEQTFPTLRSIAVDSPTPAPPPSSTASCWGSPIGPVPKCPPRGADDPAGRDWLVLNNPAGGPHLALQQVESLPPSTWPGTERPQQLHLDLFLPDPDTLAAQHARALALGARVLAGPFRRPRRAALRLRRPRRASLLHVQPARLSPIGHHVGSSSGRSRHGTGSPRGGGQGQGRAGQPRDDRRTGPRAR